MKLDDILPYAKQIMHEKKKSYFDCAWFPKDDDSDETFEALIELRGKGVIEVSGGDLFDAFVIRKGY